MFKEDDVLLDYQKAILADESQVRVVEKSRRVGVSWSTASEAALTAATTRKEGGMNVFYIGYNQDMARDFVLDVAFWAKNFDEFTDEDPDIEEYIFKDKDGDKEKDILVYEIKFASGFRVQALSSRPSNLRGKQGMVIIDEAAFHNDLPELIKAAMALLMWGGRVIVISTHDGEENPFNELILDCRAGKKPYSVHRITLQDALKDGLYKRICQKRKAKWTVEGEAEWTKGMYDSYGDAASEELDVIPSGGSGSFLHHTIIEKAFKDDLTVVRLRKGDEFTSLPKVVREFEIQTWCEDNLLPLIKSLTPNLAHYFGEDFGRIGDLTVISIFEESPSLDYPAKFIVELRNIPFEQQRQILFYILDRLPRFMAGAMDSRGNGQYLAEVTKQQYGDRVEMVMLSEAWYRNHMPRLKSHFEDGTISLPRDADILGDLRALKMIKGVAKIPDNARTTGSDGFKRHGDSSIALALGIYATTKEVTEYDYDPVGTINSRDRDLHMEDFYNSNPDWRGSKWH